jgi:hypothetical protein
VTQREDPEGQVSIAMAQAHIAMKHGPGAKFSGAQILDFEEGWAIPCFHYGVAHHLRIIEGDILAKCGWRRPAPRVRGQGIVLFGQGAFKRCVKCQRVIDRRGR